MRRLWLVVPGAFALGCMCGSVCELYVIRVWWSGKASSFFGEESAAEFVAHWCNTNPAHNLEKRYKLVFEHAYIPLMTFSTRESRGSMHQ